MRNVKKSILALLILVVILNSCIGVTASAVSIPELTITSPSAWAKISWDSNATLRWNAVSGTVKYFVSIVRVDIDNNTVEDILRNKATSNLSMDISSYIPKYPARLKIWVGANKYDNMNQVSLLAEKFIYVTIAHTPGITNGSVSEITSNSAKIRMSIDADNGYSITESGFYWGTSSSTGSMRRYVFTNGTAKGTHGLSLSNLKSGTTYYYRAFAVNEMGETCTTAKSFTTSAATLSSAPVLSVPTNWSEVTAGQQISVDWSDVAGAEGYRIHIKQLSGLPDTANNDESAENTWREECGTKSSYSLASTRVIGGYWYKFVAEAYAAGADSMWSNWCYVYVKKPSNNTLQRPEILTPIAEENYRPGEDIVFTWKSVPNATGYTYYIKELTGTPDYSDNEPAANLWTDKTTSLRYTLPGNKVKENTWYKFVVQATASGYTDGWSMYTYIKIGKNENWIQVKAPQSTVEVGEQSYANNSQLVLYDAYNTQLKTVESKAFYNCANLQAVCLPKSVRTIAEDAFQGCPKLKIYCSEGSYAESYAKRKGIATEIYGIVIKKDILRLSDASWTIGTKAAASKVITVTSPGSWTAVSSDSWLTLSARSGTSGAIVRLNAAANTGSSSRNATVTFSSSGSSVSFKVTQQGTAAGTPTVTGSWTDPSTITITKGESYRLNGNINVENGTLGVVSVSVMYGSNQALTHDYQGQTSGITLSAENDFVINTATNASFSTPGTYSLTMYAKYYGSNTAVKIGTKTLVVNAVSQAKSPVVTATTINSTVSNTGKGRIGINVTTTYADSFYIEVLKGSTPIPISDDWNTNVKKREYNIGDFKTADNAYLFKYGTLYTTAPQPWSTVYLTIPEGTAVGDYIVRVTALNNENNQTQKTSVVLNVSVMEFKGIKVENISDTIYVFNQYRKEVSIADYRNMPSYKLYYDENGKLQEGKSIKQWMITNGYNHPCYWDVQLYKKYGEEISNIINGRYTNTPYIVGRGCRLLTFAHAYQYFFGKAVTIDQQVDILHEFVRKNSNPPASGDTYLKVMKDYGIDNKAIAGMGWEAALSVLENGSIIEASTLGGEHYVLIVGYTYDANGVGYVLVVDSSVTSVYERTDKELYKYNGTSVPGSRYVDNPGMTGAIYWLKFSDNRRLKLLNELRQP